MFSSSSNSIHVNDASILINSTVNPVTDFEVNDHKLVERRMYNFNISNYHRLYYGFDDFARIIKNRDYDRANGFIQQNYKSYESFR